MSDKNSLLDAVGVLAKITPPHVCVHIGAGGRSSVGFETVDCIPARQHVLIEATERRYEKLAERYFDASNVYAVHGAIDSESGSRPFFTHSLEDESGFASLDDLRSVWPNIETVDERLAQVTSLDEILQALPKEASKVTEFNWLVIGCLPSGSVFDGCKQILGHIDVAIIRAAKTEATTGELAASSLELVRSRMDAIGLIEIASETERNGKIGHFLFCRDLLKQSTMLRQKNKDEVTALRTDLEISLREEKDKASTLAQALDATRLALDEAGAEKNELQNKLSDADLELGNTRKVLAEQKAVQKAVEEALEAARLALDEAGAEKNELQNKLSDADLELGNTRKVLGEQKAVQKAVEEALEAARLALDEAGGEKNELQKKLLDADSEVEDIRETLVQQEAARQAAEEALAGQIHLREELEVERSELNAAVENLKDQLTQRIIDIKDREAELDQTTMELSGLQHTIAAKLAEYDALKVDFEQLELEAKTNAETKIAIEGTLEAANEELAKAQKKLQLAENNLQATRQSHKEIATKLQAAEGQLVAIGNEIRRILTVGGKATDASEQMTSVEKDPSTPVTQRKRKADPK
ncbi:MAG: hypothetical protein AAGI92_02695 [Pseudomonadota bacterium]